MNEFKTIFYLIFFFAFMGVCSTPYILFKSIKCIYIKIKNKQLKKQIRRAYPVVVGVSTESIKEYRKKLLNYNEYLLKNTWISFKEWENKSDDEIVDDLEEEFLKI